MIKRLVAALVVLVAVLAVAGCATLIVAWSAAKEQENREIECALLAPDGARSEARKRGDDTVCVYRDEDGRVLKRVRLPG